MTERLANTVSGTFLLVLAIGMGVMARSLPTTVTDQYAGPGFMPTLLSICLGGVAAGILVQSHAIPRSRWMPGWSGADLQGAIRIAVVLAATAAYNLLLQPAGYIVTTAAYLLFLLRYLQVSWRLTLILTVATTVGTFALFSIWLRVVLPLGFVQIYF
ncbi:MAG: tripartite tricarboxylate transporter TctB family protein [Chloroflexota bacterium]